LENKKLNPPYCPFVAVNQIFEKNRRVTITKIDAKTLKVYGIGKGYEYKLLSALRWLGLIDEEGNSTSYLAELRVVGEEFEKVLRGVVQESYKDLISTNPPESSTREDLVNYFIQRYRYPHQRAIFAVYFVIGIWKACNLPLSDDLRKSQSGELTPQPKKEKFAGRVHIGRIQTQGYRESEKESNKVIVFVEGKRHDFDTDNDLDKMLFDTLAKGLLNRWGKKLREKEVETE
jgi:hypothetical protein